MSVAANPIFRLEDYRKTDYIIANIDLNFQLQPTKTIVTSILNVQARNDENPPLILVGDELTLLSIKINGHALTLQDYQASPQQLEIFSPPKGEFSLEIITEINPQENRQLMGLYLSNGVYCTQCEAEGFRRISYFYDRPDVLTTYTTRIEANAADYPVLLSNGNLVETGQCENGNHYAIWYDPHKKPSYLFALVAGKLDVLHDKFITMSGRKVKLGIYVETGKAERATYAMDALKRSMLWDEQVFVREYDLDIFNIVAVSDFNMGAMENKGLNIFNDKFVLADKNTASDSDYAAIERIIAHEYFHNWTGNRITCRDWFQLCLKEGLTVYRDQEFTADQRSRAVKRIQDIKLLKAAQFPEDAGPLAHAVRPRQYSEINNFYTTTIYEKGAEIIRMLHSMLGDTIFNQSMDLYFERFDGQAVTMEDFIACFAEKSGRDFSQFMLWYEQAGTPNVKIDNHYDKGVLTLEISQEIPATPNQTNKAPMLIPIAFALLGQNGTEMSFQADNHVENNVIMLNQAQQTIRLTHLTEKPVLSILRKFSAPINLKININDDDLAFLARHDDDLVNRWQSLNTLITNAMVKAVLTEKPDRIAMPEDLIDLIAHIMADKNLEPAFCSLCLSLPYEGEIARIIGKNINPEKIHLVHQSFMQSLAKKLQPELLAVYQSLHETQPYSPNAQQAGKRGLKNILLHYLSLAENSPSRAYQHYQKADNMTDCLASLVILAHVFSKSSEAQQALAHFAHKFGDDPLVMDKWFSIQATTPNADALTTIKTLMQHRLFSLNNPNRTRALIASFAASNPIGFHRQDGEAYQFYADIILQIDRKNAQLAARLLTLLRSWRQFEPIRQEKLQEALHHIAKTQNLSTDVADIIKRSLA